MAHRGFVRGARSRSNRRETQWLALPPTTSTLDNSAAFVLSLTTAELALRPFTIVRTHLTILQQSDQSAAAELQVGAVGICVVSEAASGVGVTALPTPITELDSDLWLVHATMVNQFLFADATGFVSPTGLVTRVDSKAMRKVNNDQDVAVLTEGATLGEGMLITMLGRMLIKLH